MWIAVEIFHSIIRCWRNLICIQVTTGQLQEEKVRSFNLRHCKFRKQWVWLATWIPAYDRHGLNAHSQQQNQISGKKLFGFDLPLLYCSTLHVRTQMLSEQIESRRRKFKGLRAVCLITRDVDLIEAARTKLSTLCKSTRRNNEY